MFLKVPMKRKLFLRSYKIYRLKYTIPKFETSRIKIGDFTGAQIWAILPSKTVRGLGSSLLHFGCKSLSTLTESLSVRRTLEGENMSSDSETSNLSETSSNPEEEEIEEKENEDI